MASEEERATLLSIHDRGRSLMDAVGFKMVLISRGRLQGSFVVGDMTTQPFKVLHGGVTAFVAETLASLGALLLADFQRIAGIELNVSHLRAVESGSEVSVEATALSAGKRVQVWEVKFRANHAVAAIARVTLVVLGHPGPLPLQPSPTSASKL